MSQINALTERELNDLYDDMLNAVYETVTIGGYEYETARALKLVDPIAYNCGFNDWLDAAVTDKQLFEVNNEYFTEDPNEDEEV